LALILYGLVDNHLTFYGGGSPEPSINKQLLLVLTQAMRPYVEKGLSEAQKLYETYTPKYYEGANIRKSICSNRVSTYYGRSSS
jgi:hypothetical protein